jgi:hypothetical protein
MAEELPPGTTAEPAAEPTLDVASAVADIAESLHMSEAPEEPAAEEGEAEPKEVAEGEEKPAVAEKPEEGAPAAETDDKTPSTWRKEAKEAWAALPPVVKDEIAKRESDIARYVADTSTAVKVASGFEKITAPYMDLFQKYNVNPWNHVSGLLEAHHRLLFGSPEEKVGMFRQLAKDSGINLEAISSGQAQPDNPLLEHVRALQARIGQLEGGITGVTQTVHEARLNELTQSVLEYSQDAEAHPFFDEVADDIKDLIDTKAARTLDQAYHLAILRNPRTKQKIIDLEISKRRETEDGPAAAHVKTAKKALTGMPKSTIKGRASSGPETVDDTLQKTLNRIKARDAA